MWRALVVSVLTLFVSTAVWAQTPDAKKSAATKSPAQKKLLENPNDVQAISAYQNEVIIAVVQTMQRDPAGAREKLDAMDAFVAELKVDDPMAKSRLAGIKLTAQSYRDRIDVQNVPLADLEKKLAQNADDVAAIKRFITKVQMEIAPLARTQPDLAEKQLQAAKTNLAKAREAATSEAAKRLLTSSNTSLSFLERAIETTRTPLAELGKKLIATPDNVQALIEFNNKLSMEVSPLLRSKPAEASKKIDEAKAVFQKLEETATNASVKTMVANYKRSLDSMMRTVEAGKKLTELIGKDAAPLQVETWVNGKPLKDGDLKGKVVFLDFWAVWCGPCIATFPHLRDWNAKYGDKGLVMIGVTNYYNYKWDEEAKKAARAQEKVTPVEEQEMLAKFADLHDLKHRFALESSRALSEYYGVTGIPHVVVIDQEGKIRLMKVGSGEANAKEIGALLDKLLAPKAAGGE